MSTRRIVIIGATSGIGYALAQQLSAKGYALGIAGRRTELLAELSQTLPGPVEMQRIDIAQHEEAAEQLLELIGALGGMDTLVISSGIGIHNPELQFAAERATIDVNVTGFVAMATAGYRYFAQQGAGHLVGISSVAGIRGSRFNPVYSASKVFMMNYLEALRARARHEGLPIAVTDIRPGFVDTPMTAAKRGMFWVSSADAAAAEIIRAIEDKERVAYITRRWALIAWLLRHLPHWVLERI